MSQIQVLAGSFRKGEASFDGDYFNLREEDIPVSELASLELATEETIKKSGIPLAIGGVLLLGPLGLLAGLIPRQGEQKIGFIVTFKDGRILLGTTNNETYLQIKGELLSPRSKETIEKNRIAKEENERLKIIGVVTTIICFVIFMVVVLHLDATTTPELVEPEEVPLIQVDKLPTLTAEQAKDTLIDEWHIYSLQIQSIDYDDSDKMFTVKGKAAGKQFTACLNKNGEFVEGSID